MVIMLIDETVVIDHFVGSRHGIAPNLRAGQSPKIYGIGAEISPESSRGNRADVAGHGVVCVERQRGTHRGF